MKLLPLEKLALEVGGWGVLTLLAFFFHELAFCLVLLIAASKLDQFIFVHRNTKETYDDEFTPGIPYSESSVEEYEYLPGMGANWERSVRKNLSEGDG